MKQGTLQVFFFSMCTKRERKYKEGKRNEIDKKGGKEKMTVFH